MKYPYVRIHQCLRPILPVILASNDLEVEVEALVDSGSDRNIFDAGFAEILGIGDLSNGGIETRISGVTGVEKTGYAHDIVVKFGGYAINTNVIFMPDMPDQHKAILGQEGFFDVGTIKFKYAKRTFEIKVHDHID